MPGMPASSPAPSHACKGVLDVSPALPADSRARPGVFPDAPGALWDAHNVLRDLPGLSPDMPRLFQVASTVIPVTLGDSSALSGDS